MKKFDFSQIKAGHLLVVKDTAHPEPFNMTVSGSLVRPTSREEGLACCNPDKKEWWLFSRFDREGKWQYSGGEVKIMAVYGAAEPRAIMDNSIAGRELLWERKEPMRMTMTEVCQALGFDVEIVKEG